MKKIFNFFKREAKIQKNCTINIEQFKGEEVYLAVKRMIDELDDGVQFDFVMADGARLTVKKVPAEVLRQFY